MTTCTEVSCLVGIDWATRTHEVCVLDGSRQVLGKRSVASTAVGLADLVGWLLGFAQGNPALLAVAIERPDGPVVETLLAHGIAVFSLNPKQLDRFRDRHGVAGAKDDRRDAFVLADALATDRHNFHPVSPLEPELVALRGVARLDDQLRTEENRLSNQFHDQLRRYYPQLLELAADRADPFLWELWQLAPNPHRGRALRQRTLARLIGHRKIRRCTAAKAWEALQSPALQVTPATVADAQAAIELLLPRLQLVHAQRLECGRRMERLLNGLAATSAKDQHSDVTILRSLPGVGGRVLARVLSEAAEAIRRRDFNRLRALGGSAPVTKRSGQSCRVMMRRACNPRLRFAFYHWGRTAMQRDPRCREHYASLRHRGHSHGRALRGVVDRLLAVAMAMLRAGTLYDPELRGAGRTRPNTQAALAAQPNLERESQPMPCVGE